MRSVRVRSDRTVVYNIMRNGLIISMQIKIADKSEDEIEQIALLS